MNVAGQVKDIFKVEPRLLELRSPVYIMGKKQDLRTFQLGTHRKQSLKM